MRVKVFFEKVLDFIFPTNCIVCKKSGKIICEKCFVKIPTNLKDNLNILSVYEYRNKTVNKLLWQLKYHHNGDAGKIFGKSVAEEILKWLKDFENLPEIVFIPVPLKNGDKRIHNHAEILADSISKNVPNSVVKNILKKNNSKKQAHTKNKHERILNLENSIKINSQTEKEEFKNKLLIIVDDVTTTGATICKVRNVLTEFLEIPEENILGVTVAH